MKKILYMVFAMVFLASCGQATTMEQPVIEEAAVEQLVVETLVVECANILQQPNAVEKSAPEKLLDSMSLEERVGQMFIYAFRGPDMTEFNETMSDTLNRYAPGGVILFAENLLSKKQASKLIDELKNHSETPLFVGVDEEGGIVSRMGDMYERLPSAGEIASEEEAYARGETIGQRLKELGFNMNFAPVADITTNPLNSAVGERAFPSETASEYVAAMVKGMKKNGVLSVVKHFPGHGDTEADSHYGIAEASYDLDRLMKVELVPFAAGIEAGADGVMVGHVSAPMVTGDNLPATFSKLLLTDILRDRMGFDGVIITDAMDMGAVTNYYPAGEAAVSAILAGADIILMPQNIDEAYRAVLEACKSGELSEDRINASVLRILNLKEAL